ncbi:MAG: beta-ketoacyl synthase N-terminal-like domain-containing protein [Candidatus Brocadiia bacterium]
MPSVISGMAALTPFSATVEDLFANLWSRRLAYAKLTGPKWKTIEGFRTDSGGAIPDDLRASAVECAASLGLDPVCIGDCGVFAAFAAHRALQSAGLFPVPPGIRIGLVLGTNFGATPKVQEALTAEREGRPAGGMLDCYLFENVARRIASALGLDGPVSALSLSCASGCAVIGQAERYIETYGLDGCLAVGTDELDVYIFSGLNSLRAMSPENIVRPWDKNRKGTIFSEGAGAVLLLRPQACERLEVPLFAYVRACHQNNDGFHLSAPDTTASGIIELMEHSIAASGIPRESIDFVNLHGTGTPYNDKIETLAITKVFGERAATLPAAANKGSLGHLMGAAGIVEAISTVMSLKLGIVPATANILERDADLCIGVSSDERSGRYRTAMKTSYGFGGTNSCLILERGNA